MPIDPLEINTRLQQILREHAQNANPLHSQFLRMQETSLEQVASLIEMQIGLAGGGAQALPAIQPAAGREALFTRRQLEEFATGSMAKCFGAEFQLYEQRRHPRIPNGDLLLMSRVLEIHGKRHNFDQPSSILVEYDVPVDAWYYRNENFSSLPYAIWMEIALQPCGYLAAYLGTSLLFPNVDFYFRNLDGSARILSDADVRGATIACRAVLLSTIASGSTIIQKFSFECSCRGQVVFEGQSIFGFFPPETMAAQAGLDAGKAVQPLYETLAQAGLPGEWVNFTDPLTAGIFSPPAHRPYEHLAGGQLHFLDRVFIAEPGPDRPHPTLYGLRANDPQAWFYACHFFGDPVMPGSLGVEAILEAVQLYALRAGLGSQFRSPRFGLPLDRPLSWKYRGQILPSHRQMKVEVQVTGVEQTPEQVTILANASLWADATRIYEVKNAAVCLGEAD
jgi:3-hydroxymyristoyl/3-hydroxydecanoyl-(acyl carrier protein) dehydratase